MPLQEGGKLVSGSGQFRLGSNQKPQDSRLADLPKPLPFMAKEFDKKGLPFYGGGFKGWARKTFGKIFDPKHFTEEVSPEGRETIEKNISRVAGEIEEKTKWGDWGEQFFGITAKELAQPALAIAIGGKESRETAETPLEEKGETLATVTGILKRTAGQQVSTVLGAFQALEYAVRVVVAADMGLGYAVRNSTVLVSKKPMDENPKASTFAQNTVEAIFLVLDGKLTVGDIKESVQKHVAGSQAIYTMAFDSEVRAEFQKGLEDGKDPALLAAELNNPWVELGAGIAFDPATYFGLGIIGKFGKAKTAIRIPFSGKVIKMFGRTQYVPWRTVYRLPTFTEVIGLKVGTGRLIHEADRFHEMIPEMKRILEPLKDIPTEAEALSTVRRVAAEGLAAIQKESKSYGFLAYDAAGKASILGRDAKHVLGSVMGNSRDADEGLGIIQAMVNLNNKNDKVVMNAFMYLKSSDAGRVAFSQAGIKTGNLLRELTDKRLTNIIEANRGNNIAIMEKLGAAMDEVTNKLIPSVDEMWKASKSLKAGEEVTKDVKRLAAAYKELKGTKPIVVAARTAARTYEKAWRPIVGAMSEVYMNWSARFFSRNIAGQSFGITHAFGINATVEISAKAVAGLSGGVSKKILAAQDVRLADMLGTTIENVSFGRIGSAGGAFAGADRKKGFLAAAANSEAITRGEVHVKQVFDTIRDALDGGALPDITNMKKAGLQDFEINLLIQKVKDYSGNTGKAFAEFNDITKTGFVETWRHIKVPDELSDFLNRNNVLGDLTDIQRTSKSSAEFRERAEEVVTNMVEIATKEAATEFPTIGAKVPEALNEVVMEAQGFASKKIVGDETASLFTRRVQAWQNVRDQLSQGVHQLTEMLGNLMGKQGIEGGQEFAKKISDNEAIFNAQYGKVTEVRNFVRKQYALSQEGGNAAELFVNTNHKLFDLSKIYPDVNPATLNGKQYNQLLWEAYFDYGGNTWRGANNGLYEEQYKVLDEWAKAAGTTMEDIVPRLGIEDNPMRIAAQMREQARDLERFSDRAFSVDTDALKVEREGLRVKLEELGAQRVADEAVDVDRVVTTEQLAERQKISDTEWASRDKNLFGSSERPILTKEDVIRSREKVAKLTGADEVVEGLSDIEKKIAAAETKVGKPKTELDKVRERMAEIDEVLLPSKMPPPPYAGGQPTSARVIYESAEKLTSDMGRFIDEVDARWGETTPVSKFSKEAQSSMSEWKKVLDQRMIPVKNKARVLAQKQADFILHDYNKTYLDNAAGYLSPYHYWTNRTYMKWAERSVEKPLIAATFMRFKKTMEQEHADMPEWWRYNIPINKLPGIDLKSPLYFNLMATLNPVNGLTGVDFEDPYKRVDWLSKTIDDLNSFGPTFMTPIQWAVAAELYAKGEDEAGARWMGRLLPQTKTIKAALSLLDISLPETPFSRQNELDPFVNFLSGGVDSYERPRVGRALAAMVQEGAVLNGTVITEEMADEASFNQEGELWRAAVDRAVSERAPGELFSFFAGVGFKGRTESDIETDRFYDDFHRMISLNSVTSPNDYKKGWNEMRNKYEFMDALLMAKKAGPERDRAYAYSVLNRIPPGLSDDFLSAAGLNPGTIDMFYESKGEMEGWTGGEKQRFMAAVVDLGAMLEMPNSATKNEWVDVRDAYSDMKDRIAVSLGPVIWDKVDHYYSLDRSKRKMFLANNPDVGQALDAQSRAISEDPLMQEYYGSFESLNRYHTGLVFDFLEKKYGEDIQEKWDFYYTLRLVDTKAASRFKKQNPDMADYSKEKGELMEGVMRAMVNMEDKLPEPPQVQIRPDFDPTNATQEELLQAAQPEQQITWQQWQQVLSPPLQRIVVSFWEEEEPLDYSTEQALEFAGRDFDMNLSEVLTSIGLAIR